MDLNKATQNELQCLEGIGESRARAIIEARIANGGYLDIHGVSRCTKIAVDCIQYWIDTGTILPLRSDASFSSMSLTADANDEEMVSMQQFKSIFRSFSEDLMAQVMR
jgi:hypothetical protein